MGTRTDLIQISKSARPIRAMKMHLVRTMTVPSCARAIKSSLVTGSARALTCYDTTSSSVN